MATPYFPCPEAGDVWSACTFTQMLTAFESALRSGMTHGIIGTSLQLLNIMAAFAVVFFCIWLAMTDDDQYLAHILGMGVKISMYAQLISNFFDYAMQGADFMLVLGAYFGAPAAQLFGLPPFTVEQMHDPGGILLVGWRLFIPLFDYIESIGYLELPFHLGTIVLYGIVGILGYACVLWMGVSLFFGWVELLLLASFGTPMLSFAIFEHTRFIGVGVLPTVAQCAIRLGLYATILSLIFPVLRSLQITDTGDPGWDTVLALLGVNLAFAVLCWRADSLAAKLTGGSAAHIGMGLVFLARQTRQVVEQATVVGRATTTAVRRVANGG